MCFFLNGLLGYLFFARLRAHGMFPEYMHLGLMLFFPLMGLLCSRKGDRVLRSAATFLDIEVGSDKQQRLWAIYRAVVERM